MYSDDQQLVPWLKLSNFRSEELKPGGNSQEEQCCTPRACVLDEDSDLEEGPDEELEYVQAEESKAHQATSKQEITRTNAREYVTVIAASRTWEALLHYTLTGLV
ncbi:hypothetical protein CERSUDRAFT_116438 [Gelatoporia subvermispora B]|uniref:Uncharacterized protein n=1 Tax=Ceriporiopsis subvermispora (strain B) TaxID=914234 RepID=M2R892_CERS8|nr:hypothetical protein CERSUDRAFT_116438 [Gelatoporia subvermispora B]